MIHAVTLAGPASPASDASPPVVAAIFPEAAVAALDHGISDTTISMVEISIRSP